MFEEFHQAALFAAESQRDWHEQRGHFTDGQLAALDGGDDEWLFGVGDVDDGLGF